MATFDTTRSRAIVFDLTTNETWAGDGRTGTWTQVTGQVGGPWYPSDPAMTFDAGRDRTVLFGGQDPAGTPLAETWELDGTAWVLRALPSSPPARHNTALCHDPVQNVTLLAAGDAAAQGAPAQPLADAWLYDGAQWTQIAGGPSGPAVAAFDGDRTCIVVLAENGTFEWQGGATPPLLPEPAGVRMRDWIGRAVWQR